MLALHGSMTLVMKTCNKIVDITGKAFKGEKLAPTVTHVYVKVLFGNAPTSKTVLIQ
jgi:hypothetical protein